MFEPDQSLRARIDARVAGTLDRRLTDDLAAGEARRQIGDTLRRRSVERALAIALATPIHLLQVATLVIGLGLLVLGANIMERGLGVVVLLIVTVGLPRFGRARTHAVDQEAIPAFVTLIEEIADSLGTRPPNIIRVEAEFNASAGPAGLRSRVLTIGAPLWAASSPQARVALLTHELGHFAHRDVLDGRYVWSAFRTLEAWESLFTPPRGLSTRGHRPIVATVLTWPVRMLILAYLRLFNWVSAASRRRQELYADLAATDVAGSAAAVDMLERTLLMEVADVVANRAAVDPARPDLGEAIRHRMSRLSANERTWARTQGEAEHRSVDSTHPPTIDRIRLIESVPPRSAKLVLDEVRSRAIDAELMPYLAPAFKTLGESYRYVS